MSTVQNSVGRKSNDRLGPYQWHCYAFSYAINAEVVHWRQSAEEMAFMPVI